MITQAQAAEYLDMVLGVSVPSVALLAAMERVEGVEPDMITADYTEAQITLIQCMATAIIAAAGAPRRVQSQGAPSGASRSFKYSDKDLTKLRRSLFATDPKRITAAIVGPDPETQTLLLVVG